MIYTVLTSWWGWPATAHAGCDEGAVSVALLQAEQAFGRKDLDGMNDAIGEVRKALSCMREPASPSLCARVHRARALGAWLDLDSDASMLSLRAMLHADPRSDLPNPLVAVNHPLRALKMNAEEAPTGWAELPRGGWLLVDGLRTGASPVGQPYLLQPLREDGAPLGARIVDRTSRRGGLRIFSGGSAGSRVMNWTAVGLGAASVGLYGGAWGTRSAYQGAVLGQDDPRIGNLHTATNVLSITSVVTVGLSAGTFAIGQAIR